MSMHIVLSDNSVIWWHVGDSIPDTSQVVEIRATGDELRYILERFGNLPIRHIVGEGKTYAAAVEDEEKQRTSRRQQGMRWFGDHAKFIFHNL